MSIEGFEWSDQGGSCRLMAWNILVLLPLCSLMGSWAVWFGHLFWRAHKWQLTMFREISSHPGPSGPLPIVPWRIYRKSTPSTTLSFHILCQLLHLWLLTWLAEGGTGGPLDRCTLGEMWSGLHALCPPFNRSGLLLFFHIVNLGVLLPAATW